MDVPANSSLEFDVLAPVKVFGEEKLQSWALESTSFLLLQKDAPADLLKQKISGITQERDTRIDHQVLTSTRSSNVFAWPAAMTRGSLRFSGCT
jgi:hypothetical protein